MRKFWWLFWLLVAGLVPACEAQTGAFTGYCQVGATPAVVSGLSSTNRLQGVVPRCAVTVYFTGTTTQVPGSQVFANATGTVLGNPFTANATTGQWLFFASTGSCYDVKMSGGIPPNTFAVPVTLTGLCNVGSGAAGGITALTGDVTATGPGSAEATLATVNSTTGPFGDSTHIPTITVNGKGLITNVTLASIATYMIGTTTLTPNGSNKSLAFMPVDADLPILSSTGLANGAGTKPQLLFSTNLFAWNFLQIIASNGPPQKLFNWFISSGSPYFAMDATVGFGFQFCHDLSSGSCTDSLVFSKYLSGTTFGTLGPAGASFTNAWTLGSLKLSNVTGLTQCLQGDTAGNVTGTGSGCGGATTLAGVAAGTAPSGSGTYNFNNNPISTSSTDSSAQFIASALDSPSFSATPTFSATIQRTRIVLTGNVTSSTLAAGTDGARKCFDIVQGSSAFTFAWPTGVQGAGTISATTGGRNTQCFTYWFSDAVWLAEGPMVTNQ